MNSSEAPLRAAELGFWFGVGCPACPSVNSLSLLEEEPYLGDMFGRRYFYLQGALGLRTNSLWSCSGAALGALAAAAHERELGESAKVFPQPNKTAPRAGICLLTYELCSLQTFTFPDSKPSCQKFSFIFQYFFPVSINLLSSLKYFTNFYNCSL